MSAARDRALRVVAGELDAAATSRASSRRASELVPGLDLAEAYAIQALNVRHRRARGAVLVGHKVGLTSAAMQQQMSAFEPDSGVLFDDRWIWDGGTLARRGLFTPRVEAELAVQLGAGLPCTDTGADYQVAREAVAGVSLAIEVIDSRYGTWGISLADSIADNASSAWFALGEQTQAEPDIDLSGLRVRLLIDGVEKASGYGREVLGDPVHALVWLARLRHEAGAPLQAGDVVLLGAVHASLPLPPCAHIEAVADGLAPVSFSTD